MSLQSKSSKKLSREDLNREFNDKQKWELWVVFVIKLFTSMMFLIDDLTFLVFCQYEFGMTQQESGIMFCVSALFLFAYGLTISGYLIDKMGVKFSLILGLSLIGLGKFLLTFVTQRVHLYLIMCTISPFGISIIFPTLVLAVKKLSHPGAMRSLAFNIYYGFMVFGALIGGPLVDFIRRDIGKTQFEYLHTNVETGAIEKRYLVVSAWRTIAFFGFIISVGMLILMCTYKKQIENDFIERHLTRSERERLSCSEISSEIIKDFKFWRFMLFSFVIVGSKMVFSLLFFMIPKMITQNDGENAPFGIYMSAAPMLIIIFLLFLAPVQANYEPYDLILVGTVIATLGPIPMFFGMNLINFMLFIIIISFAEALYSPMINVFAFNFTKEGREGTFLTLTSAPSYFTMAITGVLGGYLLEQYYPVKEDATHHREPAYIWLTIIACSLFSLICLYIGKNYFDIKEKETKALEIRDQRQSRSQNGILYSKDDFFLTQGAPGKLKKSRSTKSSSG
jgi:MFS family permease